MSFDFNPKVSDFQAANPNQTLVGFAWSIGWRLYLVIIGIAMVIAFFNS